MRVAIPHELAREEVRVRLKENSHKIADHVPGGVAKVVTDWPSEDKMQMSILAMGQNLQGFVAIEDDQVVIEVALPPLIAFLEPTISGAMREQGQKMLAKD